MGIGAPKLALPDPRYVAAIYITPDFCWAFRFLLQQLLLHPPSAEKEPALVFVSVRLPRALCNHNEAARSSLRSMYGKLPPAPISSRQL